MSILEAILGTIDLLFLPAAVEDSVDDARRKGWRRILIRALVIVGVFIVLAIVLWALVGGFITIFG